MTEGSIVFCNIRHECIMIQKDKLFMLFSFEFLQLAGPEGNRFFDDFLKDFNKAVSS